MQSWSNDAQLENFLKQKSIPFIIARALFSKVDREASVRNEARPNTPKDETRMSTYAEAMETSSFPMMVFMRYANPAEHHGFEFLILGGNTRFGAAEMRGETEAMVYIVDETGDLISDYLPRCLNSWHGRLLTDEEILIQAEQLMTRYKVTAAVAAADLGIKKNKLDEAIRARNTWLKLEKQFVKMDHDVLCPTALKILAPVKNDTVMAAIARGAVEHRLGTDAIGIITKAVKNKDQSEAAMLAVAFFARLRRTTCFTFDNKVNHWFAKAIRAMLVSKMVERYTFEGKRVGLHGIESGEQYRLRLTKQGQARYRDLLGAAMAKALEEAAAREPAKPVAPADQPNALPVGVLPPDDHPVNPLESSLAGSPPGAPG